jgi:hypothetical protein
VRTFVMHFDDGLIRDIVLSELNRGGQPVDRTSILSKGLIRVHE